MAIAKEMESQGHKVTCLEDKTFGIDYLLSYHNKVKRWAKYLLGKSTKKKNEYWQSCFRDNMELKVPFDILLCINGYSLCKEFFRLLKVSSPKVRTIYYLWDSCSLYAFNKNFCYFDKCTTFDWVDAKKYRIDYLPMFWIPSNIENSVDTSVFFVGTIHSDRFHVLRKIIAQLDCYKIPYYIKLFVPEKKGLLFKFMYFLDCIKGDQSLTKDISEIMKNSSQYNFVIHEHISLSEFNEKLALSTHVIDIEQPCQKALTPRTIQALSQNKKIISTNTWLKNTEFYNEKQILIIDRKNPIISKSFIEEPFRSNAVSEEILKLRIDKWIRVLLLE